MDRLEVLSAARPVKRNRTSRAAAIETRLAYASVLDAVIAVMPDDGALRFIEVHALVQELLGKPVAKSSVKNALSRNSRGAAPRFVRVHTGLYRRAVTGSTSSA